MAETVIAYDPTTNLELVQDSETGAMSSRKRLAVNASGIRYKGDAAKMGSTVVRGEVEATVETTGSNTMFGRTAALLQRLDRRQLGRVQRILDQRLAAFEASFNLMELHVAVGKLNRKVGRVT